MEKMTSFEQMPKEIIPKQEELSAKREKMLSQLEEWGKEGYLEKSTKHVGRGHYEDRIAGVINGIPVYLYHRYVKSRPNEGNYLGHAIDSNTNKHVNLTEEMARDLFEQYGSIALSKEEEREAVSEIKEFDKAKDEAIEEDRQREVYKKLVANL
jgi:hypothetical protein